MGCGRVGARIATELDQAGHGVAIIDRSDGAFERLEDDFSGQRITGSGLHRGVLERAGIENAYAFAALANGDNSNIIAARTVSQIYQVPQVVARIYDPERAELYERIGIPTVASVARTSAAVMSRLLPPNSSLVWSDPTGKVSLVQVRPNRGWLGTPFKVVERISGSKVVFVSRLSGMQPADPRMVIQDSDELIVAQDGDSAAELRRLFSQPPQAGDL